MKWFKRKPATEVTEPPADLPPWVWDDRFPASSPFVRHRGGVWWFDAPIPPPNHKCWAQTQDVGHVERCACGASRWARYPETWLNRNSRSIHR